MMMSFVKYPRTYHMQGSKGVVESTQHAWQSLEDTYLVIEEKCDGTQVGFCFDAHGQLHCQSRGTILEQGAPQDNLSLLKNWLYGMYMPLFERLSDRYLVFGEWLYAKHTIFYDQLPHYFLEFDVYDRQAAYFLSTAARAALLDGLPVHSVPVLWEGIGGQMPAPETLIGHCRFKSPQWRTRLEMLAKQQNIPWVEVLQQTDMSDEAEGLYIKAETSTETIGRYKYIRPGFIHTILANDKHWRAQRVIANQCVVG